MIKLIFIGLISYLTSVCAPDPNASLCVNGEYTSMIECEQMLEYDECDLPCIWKGDVPPAPPAPPKGSKVFAP
jgi:hypothetical protein